MTLRSYITGFVLSLICTALGFGAAANGFVLLPHILVLLALAQLFIQLKYFLHIGKETNPWNLGVLAFALLIVVFVVMGSLWIMSNLEHSQHIPFDDHISPQTEH